MDRFLAGVEAYHAHPYRRTLEDPAPVWRAGTTLLRDHGGFRAAPPVLLIPSLINRAQVLDLTPRRSLCRYLAERGYRPFLVDWDTPGEEEAAFTIGDYVTRRLEPALEAVVDRTGQRPVLIGYCMGGLLALALARRRSALARGLALLATPWDFEAGDTGLVALSRALAPAILSFTRSGEPVPVDIVQLPFALLDPLALARKFESFGRMDPASPRALDFMAVEDWLNDGVPLSGPAAKEALDRWYLGNETARGRWTVGGTPIRPEDLDLPSMVLIPERDRIVPPASALALARALPGARVRSVPLGHVGMVTGRQAVTRVHRPIRHWMDRLPPP
jgi:polyhydroxyalkanoate synthase